MTLPPSLSLFESHYSREDRVLDIACGSGDGSAALASACASVTGCDLCEEDVQEARRRHLVGNLRFEVQDGCALTFPDGAFDAVTTLHTLEHLPDDRAFLANLFRVTRPGGKLVLEVPLLRKRPFVGVAGSLDGSCWGSRIALMVSPTIEALAQAWEQEYARLLFAVPTVEGRFALARELVAHRLEAIARAYPECAEYVAAVGWLLRRNLRSDAHAEALATLSVPAPATAAGGYCQSLSHRPSGFCFYYDLIWTAADLAVEAGMGLGVGPDDPFLEPDLDRVKAEIDWQRRLARAHAD